MTAIEALTVVAIVAGPVLAVQAQKWIERFTDSKRRREMIFKTLMATRGAPLSPPHVEALNRIDLEFSGKRKFKQVVDAWKVLFDHLVDKSYGPTRVQEWLTRKEQLLTELLLKMSRAMGYEFDEVQIKRNVYAPQGHFEVEEENRRLRKQLLAILEGTEALPIKPFDPKAGADPNQPDS